MIQEHSLRHVICFELIDINECDSNPCMNGATCNNLVNMYTCDCVDGYAGDDCSTGIRSF